MEQTERPSTENPREKANVFSIITFWYMLEFFKKGYSKVLEINDLYKPLKADDSGSLGNRLETEWTKQTIGKSTPSLLKAIAKAFWCEYTVVGILQFTNEIVIRLLQPVFLGLLLEYFNPTTETTRDAAFGYAGALVFFSALNTLFLNQAKNKALTSGMKVRIATCSLIYRKSLRLSSTALGNTSVGKVVNLLSNDVSRFDMASIFLHSLWMGPLLSIIVGVLLYREVGIAGIIGMAIIAVVTPLQSYAGKLSAAFRFQTALRTDTRIRLMDEIVNGILVIKLYAWEKSFKKLIYLARDLELEVIRKASYVRGIFMMFALFTTRSALFCTMLAIVLLGGQLTASKVFVISSYFAIISNVVSQMFVRGITEIAEVLVSLKRLQTFLEHDEKEPINPSYANENLKDFKMNGEKIERENLISSHPKIPNNIALSLRNVNCRWTTVEESLKAATKKRGKKSKGIPKLSENENKFDNADAKLTLNNISLEVKRGILVGVVGHVGAGKSSLLQAILRELPRESGSLVIRGDLSFAAQEPWVFSGSVRQNILFGQEMDKERYDEVVNACALRKDFEMFPFGDQTLIGERGSSLSGGQKARVSLARALYKKADIYLLDDPLSAVDAHVGKHLFEQCISSHGFLGKQHATRILVTHQVHFLKKANWIVVMKHGMIEKQGRVEDLSEFSNESMSIEKNHKVTRSISRISTKSSRSSISCENSDDDETEAGEHEKQTNAEEMSKGKVQGNVLVNYLAAGGHVLSVVFAIFLFILTQVIASVSDYWVSFWTQQEQNRGYHTQLNDGPDDLTWTREILVYIGGSFIAALFLVGLIRSIYFYVITVRASRNLHKSSFNGIISTSIRFFDINPSGRILNRFSKDMGTIDESLPKTLMDAVQAVLMAVGSIIITVVVNPMFLLPIAVLSIVFIYIRRFYLKTSKNVKRLEGITKSLAFVHLAATLNGLSTVRAFNAQEILIKEFDQHQNLHTSVWFMHICAMQAFGFILDILVVVFIFCVTFSFLLLDTKMFSGASVGLAISQAIALTAKLQWGVRQSAEVMNQMMAVERLLEYRDLESEEDEIKKVASKTWPDEGKLKFNNVFYRYGKEMEPALRGVNFEVKPCEKVGIVGRTGAGKSSLIGSLFRIAEIEGEILIDDIDTSTISLEQLRSKISIIPQDPVLFSGSMRRNLDPFDEYSDDLLWKALEEVKLKNIAALQVQGLQSLVAAGGSNFSVGQRQLICLARAILRNNKVLVLDEATANVDPETDALIQETIREKFKNCTVMTIAHRLHTVMDSDKILVMNFGKVEEFDTPMNLLAIEGGIFADMVKANGPTESQNLMQMAIKRSQHVELMKAD